MTGSRVQRRLKKIDNCAERRACSRYNGTRKNRHPVKSLDSDTARKGVDGQSADVIKRVKTCMKAGLSVALETPKAA